MKCHKMALMVGLASAPIATVLALSLPSTAVAGAATAPGCSTVSVATVKAAMRGAPTTPTVGSGSWNGITQVTCAYGSVVTIAYGTSATVAANTKNIADYKKATIVTTVSGIGNSAFSVTSTNDACTYANGKNICTNSTLENLWVLVTGKSYLDISGNVKTATLAKLEALAKQVVKVV